MEIKPIEELSEIDDIIKQIRYQTKIFSLYDYFNDKYANLTVDGKKLNKRENLERAALIRITRNRIYKLIAFSSHINLEYALNHVVYDMGKSKYNDVYAMEEKKIKQAINEYLKINYDNDNIIIEMCGDYIGVFLPNIITPYQQEQLKLFADDLYGVLKEVYKKIYMEIATYFPGENGLMDQKTLGKYEDYLNSYDDFIEVINRIKTQINHNPSNEKDIFGVNNIERENTQEKKQ